MGVWCYMETSLREWSCLEVKRLMQSTILKNLFILLTLFDHDTKVMEKENRVR